MLHCTCKCTSFQNIQIECIMSVYIEVYMGALVNVHPFEIFKLSASCLCILKYIWEHL